MFDLPPPRHISTLRISSVAMGPAEGHLTEPTADTRACWWKPLQVSPRDLGLALKELAHITISASYSNSGSRSAPKPGERLREPSPTGWFSSTSGEISQLDEQLRPVCSHRDREDRRDRPRWRVPLAGP